MLTSVMLGSSLLSGCSVFGEQDFNAKLLDLRTNPDDTYCKIEQSDGGVVFIRNDIAAQSAAALQELPSCHLLYHTFYTHESLTQHTEMLQSDVHNLRSRVSSLENKK